MNKTRIAPCVYKWEDGRYSHRVKNPLTGRRTERMIVAKTDKQAIRAHLDWSPSAVETMKHLAEQYLEAGAPNRRGEPRDPVAVSREKGKVEYLMGFFAKLRPEEIARKHCLAYHQWRTRNLRRPGMTGDKVVDLELSTLSNVLNYAVLLDLIKFNPIATGRPCFQSVDKKVTCREKAPRSGDEIHRVAEALMNRQSGEVLAWQMLTECLTGLRTGEAITLQWTDDPETPGFLLDGGWLVVSRSKRKRFRLDRVVIHPALADLITAMHAWKEKRHPGTKWWFPSPVDPENHVEKASLTHALHRLGKGITGRRLSSHGMRAFYVEWRRSIGISDFQIAGELGHLSGGANLIWDTYGNMPATWSGGKPISLLPSEGEPVWARWLPKGDKKIVDLSTKFSTTGPSVIAPYCSKPTETARR